MGVYVEKSTLSHDAMHDGASTRKRARDDDAAMALVVTTKPRTPTYEWPSRTEPTEFSLRRVEHVKTQYCRSMGISRKRRLSDAEERPTKYTKLSTCKTGSSLDVEADTARHAKLSRPRSLHFALPGLSSRETVEILGELVSVGHELQWLNSTRPGGNSIIPVFGWRAAVWSVSSPTRNDAVVYKSAKAFEGVGIHDIARNMWMWRGSEDYPELSAPQLVYAISKEIRIVRQEDCLHGRAPRSSLWLECIRGQGESIIMVRKELHRFQENISGARSPSERECHGYILHPLLVPMRSQVVAGAALHSIGSLRTRGLSTKNQIDRIVADMPRHVLQWEDCFVNDPSRL